MTGFWVGQYSYRWPGIPAVPFFANVEDADGALTGSIDEPNSMAGSSARLASFIRGDRSGLRVGFAKVYDGAGDMAHRVDYEGTLSADGLSVAGAWSLAGDTGAFRMTREAVAEEPEEQEVEISKPAITEPIR